MVTEMIYKMVV